MKKLPHLAKAAVMMAGLLACGQVLADGDIGEHVNDMQAHLDHYTEEVEWIIDKIDGIVDTYEAEGLAAAQPEAVVDHWEAVDFHSAIETNYVPLYASIWQGLFGVRQAIENGAPVAEVRQQQVQLEEALWQSLGAVKLAAQLQKQGKLTIDRETVATTPTETLAAIKIRLDRVVAKVAEKLGDEATGIVHDTYLSQFEGVEGMLIEQDADLVEDLEIDFNVTLPKAIADDAGVDAVREVVEAMQVKLDRCIELLEAAEASRSDVF